MQGAVCFGINSPNSTGLILARAAVRKDAARTPGARNQLGACLPHPVPPAPPTDEVSEAAAARGQGEQGSRWEEPTWPPSSGCWPPLNSCVYCQVPATGVERPGPSE